MTVIFDINTMCISIWNFIIKSSLSLSEILEIVSAAGAVYWSSTTYSSLAYFSASDINREMQLYIIQM